MRIVTAAEMRELDRLTIEQYGTPGFRLMERAGKGATRALLEAMPQVRRGRVVVCAGRGNNGGDGFIIARELKAKRVAVEVFLLGRRTEVRGDAARALASYARARGKLHECHGPRDVTALQARLEGAAAVVDAIFGTGLRGPVEGLAADVITLINASGVPVFAVDIPSGLDADRGVPLDHAVQAEVTATFGFAKVGQVIYPGVDHVGDLAVVDIGIAPGAIDEVQPRLRLLERDDVSPLVPRRGATAHKGDCGHVLIIAGARGKTGAAMLAARAATRTGAGLVTVASPASQQPIIANGVLEAMTEPLADHDGQLEFDAGNLGRLLEAKRSVVFGPGIGTGEGAQHTLEWLLEHARVPLVIDADGLTCVARCMDRVGQAHAPVILTPHPGEMSRLTGMTTAEVQADRIGVARSLATAQHCTIVLKGARSVIAAPDGAIAINSTGNPGMASGGMGDVLSGIVGALLGQIRSPVAATNLGVYIHGLAADLGAEEVGPIGLIASDVIARIPRALAETAPRQD